MALEGLGNGKGALEALGRIIGKRPYQRRTQGHPGRTRALAALYAAQIDNVALANGRTVSAATAQCDVLVPQLEHLAMYVAHAWAGEGGWDTERVIDAVKAAADKHEMPAMGGD